MNTSFLESKLYAGASFKPSTLTEEFNFEDFTKKYPNAIPLALISKKGKLKFFYEGHSLTPYSGSIIIALR